MEDEDRSMLTSSRRAGSRRALAHSLTVLVAGAACLVVVSCGPARRRSVEPTISLAEGWEIQPSSRCAATAEAISTAAFNTTGWYPTSAPATVMAALVRNGAVPDPFADRNLETIDAEQFRQPWWYRTEFTVDAATAASHVRLVLEGINYSADVWLNGQRVADRNEIRGAFRVFTIDISGRLTAGVNVLAVQVVPPVPGDFTIGFVDWNPPPPDRNMGIWRPVKLRVSDAVALDDVFVRPGLDTALQRATLTVAATLMNTTDRQVETALSGAIEERRFARTFTLAPGERRVVTLTAADVPELLLEHPRLWWPNNLGEPNLYTLDLAALVRGAVSDRQSVTFGVRTVADYVNDQGHRGYTVNGRPVLIKGGGWVDDLFLREDPARLEAQLVYARHMNLNTIRLEGFWGSSQRLYDLADRYGIMVMAGFSCQWEWKSYLGKPVDETYGGILTADDMELVGAYFRDQVTWLRNHPSIFVWVVGSDMLPRPEFEKACRETLAAVDPSRPLLAACSTRTSVVSGPTGVKMNGPYDYVTPNYWYEDSERGGAFGFNTETGPGPQPPPIESLARMLPPEHLWPIDAMWDYHCARGEFKDMDRYLKALDKRYGTPPSAAAFARTAQLANYEAMRAMFEAFVVRRPATTGIIQWMYNAAWPKLYWQLYDYYLRPTGAYFGARTACRPRNLIYDYGTGAIWAVNDTREALTGATAEIKMLDLHSKLLLATSRTVDVAADAPVKVLDRPALVALTPVYFLDLRLKAADGTPLASSYYWLSTKKDVLDEPKSEWFVTPNKAFADFTALAKLPPADVAVAQSVEAAGEQTRVRLTLTNRSDVIAFFIELRLLGEQSGTTILPVLWDDNYLSLLPGESRTLTATVRTAATAGEHPVVRLSGWNVKAQ